MSLEHTGLYREVAEGPQPAPHGASRRDTFRHRLSRWKSHKVVSAAKILDIAPRTSGEQRVLVVQGASGPLAVVVPQMFIERHNPECGGYYVLYPDGYESYSPAKAFEDGYREERDGQDERPVVAPGGSGAAQEKAPSLGCQCRMPAARGVMSGPYDPCGPVALHMRVLEGSRDESVYVEILARDWARSSPDALFSRYILPALVNLKRAR